MNNFELAFTNFLREHCQNTEVVSDVLSEKMRNFPNADYLFYNRNVIAELKCLEEEKYPNIHKILQDLLNKREILGFKKGMTIEEVLKDHPRKDKIKEMIYQKITSSLMGALEKANRQIRETKNNLDLKNSQGLALLLNRDNTVLEPMIAYHLINRALLRKNSDGRHRYEELVYVIYISDVHFQPQPAVKRNAMPFIVITRKDKLNDFDKSFLNEFREMWGKFRGIPVDSLEEATTKDFNSIQFTSKEKDFESLCDR